MDAGAPRALGCRYLSAQAQSRRLPSLRFSLPLFLTIPSRFSLPTFFRLHHFPLLTMVDACETRLDIHLRGRALRDMDLFSKSDPFAVLYIDAAGSGAGDHLSPTGLAFDESHRRSSISTASSRRSAGSSSRSHRRRSDAAPTRPWGSSSDIPVRPAGRSRDAGLPPPMPSGGVRPAAATAFATEAAAGAAVGEKKKKKSRHRDGSWSQRAAAAAADARRWTRVGVTETIPNQLNPQWVASFEVPYFFERTQWLCVKVYDRDTRADQFDDLSAHDFIGEASIRIPELVRANGQAAEVSLACEKRPGASNGWVTFVAEEVSTLKQAVHLDFGVEHIRPRAAGVLGLGTAAVRLNISRLQEVGRDWLRVHQSGVGVPSARAKGCFNFPRHTVNTQKLCRGDPLQPMRVSIVTERAGKERLVAEAEVNLRQLVNTKRIPLGCEGKDAGSLVVHAARLSSSASFLDYIMGGCEVSLVVGVDFTASNGDPSSPGTLHYTDRRYPNEYELAIRAVGDILALYDTDQVFQAYGFGGKLPPDYATASHCFALNGTDSPDCAGIDGVLNAYRAALEHVRLSGPTVFSEILDRVATDCANQRVTQATQRYSILLLITDGTINDLEATMEQLIRASRLPISVVILGVGDADWTDMTLLDADDEESPLHALVERDIVQFVPFRSYRNTPEVLASKVLEEIPGQLLGFMKSRDIRPNPPVPLGTASSLPPAVPPLSPTHPAPLTAIAPPLSEGTFCSPQSTIITPRTSHLVGVSPAMTHVVTSKIGEVASATASAAVLAATAAAPDRTGPPIEVGEREQYERQDGVSSSGSRRRRHRRHDIEGGSDYALRPPGYPPARHYGTDGDGSGGGRRHRQSSGDRFAAREAARAATRTAERAATAAATGVPAAADDWGASPLVVTGTPSSPVPPSSPMNAAATPGARMPHRPRPSPPSVLSETAAAAAVGSSSPQQVASEGYGVPDRGDGARRQLAASTTAVLPAPTSRFVMSANTSDLLQVPKLPSSLNDDGAEEERIIGDDEATDDSEDIDFRMMEQQLAAQQRLLAEQQARLESRRRRPSTTASRSRSSRRVRGAAAVAGVAAVDAAATPPTHGPSAAVAWRDAGDGPGAADAAALRWQQMLADDAPPAASVAPVPIPRRSRGVGSRRADQLSAEEI